MEGRRGGRMGVGMRGGGFTLLVRATAAAGAAGYEAAAAAGYEVGAAG
jgi:hypothetical protein